MSDYFERIEGHLLDALERADEPRRGRERPGGFFRSTRHSRRAALATSGVAAIAGAVVLALALTAGKGQSAYAVVVRHDGSVALTLNELVGIEPANARLTKLGVRARLLRRASGCTAKARPLRWVPEDRPAPTPAHLKGKPRSHKPARSAAEELARSRARLYTPQSMYRSLRTARGVRIVIYPKAIPHGLTLVLAFRPVYPAHPTHGDRGQIIGVGGSVGLYRDPPPSCLPSR